MSRPSHICYSTPGFAQVSLLSLHNNFIHRLTNALESWGVQYFPRSLINRPLLIACVLSPCSAVQYYCYLDLLVSLPRLPWSGGNTRVTDCLDPLASLPCNQRATIAHLSLSPLLLWSQILVNVVLKALCSSGLLARLSLFTAKTGGASQRCSPLLFLRKQLKCFMSLQRTI